MVENKFDYTFVCDKCGGTFYSKVDPSGWHRHLCNACSGKPYKDYPVGGSKPTPTYQPKPVPIKPVYNKQAEVQTKAEFNLQEYISDLLVVYTTLRDMCDESGLTIPQENLCAWTTGIMINKGKASII